MTHLRLFSPLFFLLLSPHPVDCRSKYQYNQNGLQLQGMYVEQNVKSSYLRTRNLNEESDGEETLPTKKDKNKKIKKKSEGEVSAKRKGRPKKTKKGAKEGENKKTTEASEKEKDYLEKEKNERKKSEKKSEEEESQSPKANDLDLVKEIETPKETYEKAKNTGKKKSDGETSDSSSSEDSASPPSMPSTPIASPPTVSIHNDDETSSTVTMTNTTDEESLSENLMFASCSDSNIAFSAASVETSTTSQSNSSAVASTSEAVDEDTEKTGTVGYRYQIETRTDTPSDDTMTRIKEDIFHSLADDLCDDERRLTESMQHIHRHLKIVQISSPPLDYRSSKDCLLEYRSFDGVCNVYKGKIHFMINDEGSLTRISDTKALVKLLLTYYAETTNFTAIDSDLLGMGVLEDEEGETQNDSDSSSTSSSSTTTETTPTTESAEEDEKDEEVTTSTAMLSVTEEEVTSSGPSDIAIVGIVSAGLLALGILFFAGYAMHKRRTPLSSLQEI